MGGPKTMGAVCATDDAGYGADDFSMDLPRGAAPLPEGTQACGISVEEQMALAERLKWSDEKMRSVKQLFTVLGNPTEQQQYTRMDVPETVRKLRVATHPTASSGEYYRNLKIFVDPEGTGTMFNPQGTKHSAHGVDQVDVADFLENWVTRSDGSMQACMNFTNFCEAFNSEVHWA